MSEGKTDQIKGLRLYCPSCNAIQVCPATPLWKLKRPKGRRWYFTHHKDIQWFRRGRTCSVCLKSFLTAEISEALVDELLAMRGLLAERNQKIVRSIRRKIPWLKNPRKETIPREIAAALIRGSLWWDTHSSGQPVRSRGHADHIHMGHYGWTLDMGGNSILIGLAIERCCRKTNELFEEAAKGKLFRKENVAHDLKSVIRSSVANYDGIEYQGEYTGGYSNEMQFGAHHMDLGDAVNVMMKLFLMDEFIVDKAE